MRFASICILTRLNSVLFWFGSKNDELNNIRACFMYMRVKLSPTMCNIELILESEKQKANWTINAFSQNWLNQKDLAVLSVIWIISKQRSAKLRTGEKVGKVGTYCAEHSDPLAALFKVHLFLFSKFNVIKNNVNVLFTFLYILCLFRPTWFRYVFLTCS